MGKWRLAKNVWLVLSYAGLVVLFVLFHGKLTVSLASLGPLATAGVMLLQFFLYRYKKAGEQVDYHVYTLFTEDEKEKYEHLFADVIVCFLPFQIALICFLSDTAKIILSVAVYFAAIFCIAIFWRLLYGREVKARLEREEQELEAQIERERQGKLR